MNASYFTAYASHDRIQAISEVQDIIGKFGYVVDFKKFSDIAIVLVVEIEERKVDPLYEALKPLLSMDYFTGLNTTSAKECTVYINITFHRGTGDLRIDVPSVPG